MHCRPMGVWPRFLFLLFPNKLAWCCIETGFPPCPPGPPAHPASSCLYSTPRKTVPTAAAGRGLWSKDTKGVELSCFSFSSRVPGAPHLSPQVWLGCGGGGKGEQPRFGFKRCISEMRPTPPVTAGQPHVTIPLLSSSICLCGASKRAHRPLPV